ncbi:MAG: PBP1A family penicillin-binding protein [Aquimonas sp.]|nr:PBP1A family penicillin-binding protein [Aquimonas sp.]
MRLFRRLLRLGLILGVFFAALGLGAIGIAWWLITPTLPDVQTLRDVRLQMPLTVQSSDGKLIALFGEARRQPKRIDEIPEVVKQAVIAIEDARFYEHPGIDWRGITRAVWLLATSGQERVAGGSTITQQVAKMFFLSSEYTFKRKLTEMFLALKMERELSKDEILELYLNKSFFGNRAYGIAAAADFYYGKPLEALELHEAAMLAGIPKFPSSGNPLTNPQRAGIRRDYILQRMHEVGFIDANQLAIAQATPDPARPNEPAIELEAPFVAEIARQFAMDLLGADAMADGHRIFTTVDSRGQAAANAALRRALLDYDRRHGWRGPEARIELPDGATPAQLQRLLRDYPTSGGLHAGLVLESTAERALLMLRDGQQVELLLEQVAWARPYLDENRRGPAPRAVDTVLSVGDLVRVLLDDEGSFSLSQIPRVQAALAAVDADSGAVRALTGGFSFALNKFNRATQAQRQPGSSFKPFVYAAAFERGFGPGSVVLDAPVVFRQPDGSTWRPQNDNATFAGPMRLREAMVTSRNLVSVRLLDAIGASFAKRYIQSFGFSADSLPESLSLALGTSSVSPLDMARGFAFFENGGYLVEPWFVDRIEDRDGNIVFQHSAPRACRQCPQRLGEPLAAGHDDSFDLGPAKTPASAAAVDAPADSLLAPRQIDERTAYLVNSLLRDVVRRGTGRNALVLGRSDIGGKTGSTNDHRDAWFVGVGGGLAVASWVGMDDFSSLGRGEFGARAALPIWIDYMREALDGVPESRQPLPTGIATVMIDPQTGALLPPGSAGGIAEMVRVEDISRLERRVAADARVLEQRESFDIF